MRLNKTIHNRIHIVLLLGIILIGLWLRLQGPIHGLFAYTYDVGRDMLAVNQIVHQHKIPLIGPTTGVEGIFYGPWWYYILTIPFIIVGGNPAGISAFMALLGVLTVVLGYLAGRKIGGENLGLIFAGLLSLSPIMNSSQIWNPYLAFPVIGALLLLLAWIYSVHKNERSVLFLYIGICLGLILDSEIVFGTLFSAGVMITLILSYKSVLSIKRIVLLVLGFFIILSPRLFFDLRHNFLMSRKILSLVSSGSAHTTVSTYISHFYQRIFVLDHLWNNTVGNGNNIIGGIVLLSVVAVMICTLRNTSVLKRKFYQLCGIIILTFLFGLTLFNHDIFDHYTIALPIIFLLLLSLCAVSEIPIPKLRWLSKGLVILLFAYLTIPAFIGSFNAEWVGDISVYKNQVHVIDYVYGQAAKRPFSDEVYTPPVHDYTYQYLFLWYGQKKYGYQPIQNGVLKFYILEPDPQFPSRLEAWLTVRKQNGRIIKSTVLPGSVTVQTRTTRS